MTGRPSTLLLGLLVTGVLAGCQEPVQKVTAQPPGPVKTVASVVLAISPPAVMQLEDRPGSEGVRLRVFFVQAGKDLPVTVSGALSILLYESLPTTEAASEPASPGLPFRTWDFTGAMLNQQHLAQTIYGWGYILPISWGDRAPRPGRITFQARYTSPEGNVVYSEPVTIPTAGK